MTTDRHEQARAEAERRSPRDSEGYTTSEARGEFRAGVQWVNAQPRTITREELAEAVGILEGAQEEGALGTDALYQALIHLRIEVTDDAD